METKRKLTIYHGIEKATYVGGPGESYYLPVLECCCGWQTERSASWETAGAKLDRHLKEKESENGN